MNGKFGGGEGTKEKPFLIEDAADLFQIRNHLKNYFKLVDNINLGEPPYNSEFGWQPIEDFTGHIDGNNKRIYNLTIRRATEDNVGLFSTYHCSDTQNPSPISNVSFENVSINGKDNVGCIVGKLFWGTCSLKGGNGNYTTELPVFDNVYVNGGISGNNNVGSFVGQLYGDLSVNGKVIFLTRDCVANTQLAITNSDNTYIGQILGLASDTWNSPIANMTAVKYVRTVGRSMISSSTKKISKAGNFSFDLNARDTFVDCFMDTGLWEKTNFNNENAGIQYVDSSILKKLETQAPLVDIMQGKIHKWSTFEGSYPQLTIAVPDYFFVQADNEFYYFDLDDGEWKQVALGGKSDPSKSQIINFGMKTLQDIPNLQWNFFKGKFSKVTLYNAIDKTDSTHQTHMPLNQSILTIKESIPSDSDKKVNMSMKVKLNNNYGVLSEIKGW